MDDGRWALVLYTDGACIDNGQPNPRAGWAFWYGTQENPHIMSGRLESKGPFGHDSPQTSNRAELRAVLAALRFRKWAVEVHREIVIATDSEYVVAGITDWVKKWIRKGWVSSDNKPVKNQDLWEAVLGEVERFYEMGTTIKFWKIPRGDNKIADRAAKAAAYEEYPDRFLDIGGVYDPLDPVAED
jgi:ribonuclease HI